MESHEDVAKRWRGVENEIKATIEKIDGRIGITESIADEINETIAALKETKEHLMSLKKVAHSEIQRAWSLTQNAENDAFGEKIGSEVRELDKDTGEMKVIYSDLDGMNENIGESMGANKNTKTKNKKQNKESKDDAENKSQSSSPVIDDENGE